MDYLHEGLLRLGYTAETHPDLEEKLARYATEIEETNKIFDIVGADTRDDIVIRHLLDSLSAGKLIKSLYEERRAAKPASVSSAADGTTHPASATPRIADIGSGGGLPGIPLALAMPDAPFTLVERMSRRAAFLEHCVSTLGMANVTVQNLEAERVAPESFDVIVFRAFRPLDKKIARMLLRMLRRGGSLAAYKAKPEKIAEEMEGIRAQVPEYRVEPLEVPFLTDGGAYSRNLVIVQKPAQ